MNKIRGYLQKTFFEILPAFIFFFVMFHILSVSRALLLKQYGITVPASAMATIGALIMAKVVFLTNKLPFLNFYPRKPLIYNVIAKTVAFSIAAMIFLILEELLRISIKTGSLSMAWERLVGENNWPAFALRQTWLSLLILFYCAAIELVRSLGTGKVKDIFLKHS
jgi:hypothetical protein